MTDKKPHIVFLFSDTGGGHRSAAEAIIEALHLEYGEDAFSIEMVDFFKKHAPLPLNRFPEWYPYLVKLPSLWGASFKLSDGRPQARAITAAFWPYVARAARQIVRAHPADLIVSVHPLANSSILKALGKRHPPFVTVVTDMVTTHALWFDQRSDLILVPTEIARERAIHYRMEPEKVRVAGQPVAERYCVPRGDKRSLRQNLGWPLDRITVVMVGGGEGMGPLEKTAHAIAESGLDVSLVIVTGRNAKLKKKLESQRWSIPTTIYGFTKEMPDFMAAADVLVTKAGPGTIAEAMNAGLPTILYAKLPGQEDGNVTYTISVGAGVWAPKSHNVVETLRNWVDNPAEYKKKVDACKAAARPQASRTIARAIGEKLGVV